MESLEPCQLEEENISRYVDFSSQVLSSSYTCLHISIVQFTPRTHINWLRGTNKLQLPRVNTTSHGENSFKFLAPKLWNMLNDDLKTATSITFFRNYCLDFVN